MKTITEIISEALLDPANWNGVHVNWNFIDSDLWLHPDADNYSEQEKIDGLNEYKVPMTVERTKPRGMRVGKGFNVYGSDPHNRKMFLDGTPTEYGEWVEKWFPTIDKAVEYCAMKKWAYEVAK